ncbi:glycosyltransferase domain-containing protein [Halorubrum sp. CGM4_25_10-8A]|uniref:glycosyltransferase domain-containing protein n=1 Tax=Halorubrum sp. CGM4_25_10-8A TaxID=2518116 RepID=UPI0010F5FB4F|nr:glycosyltransferase domain-containing protein [Halorubrum sp. CGM4_25_10-8A]TKX40350.1 DUF616 domain-containing protein [Halorubrum sp. CGM4_25_10-8A]
MKEGSKTVVYTAVFGDYDVVLPPKCLNDCLEFVCFTDSPEKIPEPWNVRTLSEQTLSPKLKSGKVKTLPHRYFPEYHQSIWVDANIGITGDIDKLLEEQLIDFNLAVPEHPYRSCIYNEAEALMERGIIEPEVTQALLQKYERDGFPKNFGLSETRVLLRNHQNTSVKRSMDTWWEEYHQGPERDQLSFEYAMWKSGLEYNQLASAIAVNSEYFRYFPHKRQTWFPEHFERLLRNSWRSSLTPKSILASFLLSVYLSTSKLNGAKNVFMNEGIGGVFTEIERNIRNFK